MKEKILYNLYLIKMIFKQFYNIYIKKNYAISEKGLRLYKYCFKVASQRKMPITYEDHMLEKAMFVGNEVIEEKRVEQAMGIIQIMTPMIPPLTFIKFLKEKA